MDEEATFEARAVLAPRRARRARLALLLPAVALVVIAWAGFSGARSDQVTAIGDDPTAIIEPSLLAVVAPRSPRPEAPARALGIPVQRLDDIQSRGLGRDDLVAVTGWYVAKAVTDCPLFAEIYQDASLSELRGDTDKLAYCARSGVLYSSRPDDDRFWTDGLPGVRVTVVNGVRMPPELEVVGEDATEVIFLARFVETGDTCRSRAPCPLELLVDHVAWTPFA